MPTAFSSGGPIGRIGDMCPGSRAARWMSSRRPLSGASTHDCSPVKAATRPRRTSRPTTSRETPSSPVKPATASAASSRVPLSDFCRAAVAAVMAS